jgi:ribonuclease-3
VKRSKPIAPDFAALEKSIGYNFRNPALLERSVTHRSWAHEQVAPGEEEAARRLHNEALEFLGDSVLGFIIADYLFQLHPDITEGELSRMKHRLVSATTLAGAAEQLALGQFLRVGRGEEKTGGRRKCALLADAFEAVLAAIFLDGGTDAATRFVHQALAGQLESADPESAAAADYKTMLQERLQALQGVIPQYVVTETNGPPHRRTFHVEVTWNGGRQHGQGRSIKAAETVAARRALESLNEAAD